MSACSLVECWDLDDTILRTMKFVSLVCGFVAEHSSRSPEQVLATFEQVRQELFSPQAWFEKLDLEPSERSALQEKLTKHVQGEARDLLYPGIREFLEERQALGVRLVLITSGDIGYQVWKFSLLGLENLFQIQDRHCVSPKADKSDCIRPYLREARVTLIDDNQKWLELVRRALTGVRRIRVAWPEGKHHALSASDFNHWHSAVNVHQLRELLADS
ncbi:MAG: HAD family hydrolase [Patescibacteria group bacterium]